MNWLALVVTAVVVWVFWEMRARRVPGMPVVEGWLPWFGSLFVAQRVKDRLYDYLLTHQKKFRRSYCWGLPMTGETRVQIEPTEANAEWVLKRKFPNYPKPKQRMECFGEIFGEGIFGVNGEKWMIARKAASHMFTARELKGYMTSVILDHCDVLLERLTDVYEEYLKNPQHPGIDFQDLAHRFTLDSFAEIAFGEKLNCLAGADVPFSRAFDLAQYYAFQRMFKPWWKIERFFQIGTERLLAQNLEILDDFAYSIIRRRKAELEEGQDEGLASRQDLVSHFITTSRKSGEEVAEKQLRDLVINFLIAGRDTTATLLSWFFYELSRHPHVEAKVIEEVQEAISRYGQGGKSSFEASKAMTYTEAALCETLRLHPSVPGDHVEAASDDTLPDGSFIPAGTLIAYSPYVWGHSEVLWGPDAEEFKPERWLSDEKDGKAAPAVPSEKFSQYKFIAFNAGPRICLGKGLALLEAKLVVSTILSRFRLRVLPGQEIIAKSSIIAQMKNGMYVLPEPAVQQAAPS